MDEAAKKDLELLIKRRWDPRIGMGKHQGRFEWAIGIAMVVGLFSGVFIPYFAPFWAKMLPVYLFYGSALILICSWAYTRGLTNVRIAKRVKKHDGFLCVWCNYPFTGLGDQGHCPECGAGYTKELCQRMYGQMYRKYTPSRQEFGKRESQAWREAISYRENPELIEPSPPPVVEIVEEKTGLSISLNQEQLHEVDQLVRRRIDPRKGVGTILGMTKYLLFVLSISFFFIVIHGIIPAVQASGVGALKWMLIYIAFFIGFLICWLIPIGVRKRTLAKARKYSFILCPWCRHGLSHLPELGKCPGCGAKFKRSICESLYQNAYREFRPSKEEFREREEQGWREAVWLRDQES